MTYKSEFVKALGCFAVGAIILAGSIWFYLSVMCSSQNLVAASRSERHSLRIAANEEYMR